jgi:hypothetical protein
MPARSATPRQPSFGRSRHDPAGQQGNSRGNTTMPILGICSVCCHYGGNKWQHCCQCCHTPSLANPIARRPYPRRPGTLGPTNLCPLPVDDSASTFAAAVECKSSKVSRATLRWWPVERVGIFISATVIRAFTEGRMRVDASAGAWRFRRAAVVVKAAVRNMIATRFCIHL